MKKYISIFFSGILFLNIAFAQTSNKTTFKSLEEKFNSQFIIDKTKADSISKLLQIPLRFENPNGEVIEFSRFEKNGEMLFRRTNNIGAGRTISTNKVWPNGTIGTSLTGSGLTGRLGEWDGGGVLTTHQEFNGRVTQVDVPTSTIVHATHVAGTMVASGVTANAIGMAYQATLSAYDWSNDASEMFNAATNGMLLSNHSYGTICAWYNNPSTGRWEWYGNTSISSSIDYKYGYYSQEASDWDNIAYQNPYYLICKAAGNDRGSNISGSSTWYVRDNSYNWIQGTGTIPPAVTQYDCVEPTATAKNVLTVGAVNKIGNGNTNNGWTQSSDVVMSTFSGWGPTDDGRIKPDVVAAGVNTYSTSNSSNTSYATLSGTSMATPSACGSLLLVQQHFSNLKGKYMLAATLKGIAIHTADEAGNIGPDYVYGWGLLNIGKAVKLISDSLYSQIQEKTLANGATYTQNISSDGTVPLRITISWTDLPGSPGSIALNDPTRRLINDLDIRLKRVSDNTVFMPFVLNPILPTNAATTGDNIRDNVEQVYLSAPTSGAYILTVTHKGTLSTSQNYSLIVSGVAGPPSVVFTKDLSTVCTGQTVTFTDNSVGAPTIFQWYFPGGTPSTASTKIATVTYNTPGKFPMALKVSNALGSDSVYYSNAIVAGGLTLPFSENFESTSSSLNLWTTSTPVNDTPWRLVTVAGSLPGNKAYSMPFYVYPGSGQRDGLISPALNFSGLSAINLTFKHAYTRYANNSSDSLIVYISTNCGTTWTRILTKGENGSGTFATAPGTSYLSTSSFNPTSAANWCGGGIGAACSNINLSSYAGMNNIKIKFESYNNSGNNLYIDNIDITGTYLNPIANFRASKNIACANDVINFADSSQNISTSWKWTFTGGFPPTSTLQNPTGIIYSTAGNFPVKLKITNPTSTDSITKTNFITIYKTAPINISGNTTSHFNLTETYSVPLDTGSTYVWNIKGGTQLTGTNSNTITVKWNVVSIGTVQVRETAKTGCLGDIDSINVALTPNTGIATVDFLNGLKVFPNPANNFVNIEFESLMKQHVEVSMLNMLGQKIFTETVTGFIGNYNRNINTSEIKKGIYFIEVKTENGSTQMKIVIE